jgi:hypothetical protein
MNGIFDAKSRFELFKAGGVQLFVPSGRIKFFQNEGNIKSAPNFQSIYVCHGLLPKDIVFE